MEHPHPTIRPWTGYDLVKQTPQAASTKLLPAPSKDAEITYDEYQCNAPLDPHNTPAVGPTSTWQLSWLGGNFLLWGSEFLSLLFGVVIMIVIAVVLANSDGKAPPRWPLGITLNTMLALLTSLARIAFTIPIVEGLSQLKWIWFKSSTPRPLADFALFDSATKGPWGCIKLILRLRGLLACFGALIAISGVVTSTLTQQAVDYQQLQAIALNGTATVPRATTFSLFNGSDLALGPLEMVRGKQAMFNGALSIPTKLVPPIAPDCSSGNCDWERYGSLGVCSEVVNLTAAGNATLLKKLSVMADQRLGALLNSTSLFMSEGLFFTVFPLTSLPPAFPTLVGEMPNPSGMFNASVTQLMVGNYFVAYSNDLLTGSDIATSPLLFLEVALFWCTKSYTTHVRNGMPTTVEEGSTAFVLTPDPHTLNFAWSLDFAVCYISQNCAQTLGGLEVELEGPPMSRGSNGSFYYDTRYTVNVWTSLLSSVLLGSAVYDSLLMDQTRGIIVSTGGGVAQAFATAMFGDFLATTAPSQAEQFESAEGIAANLAGSITNHVRSGDTRLVGGNDRQSTVFGTVYTPQTFVRIQWEYIGLLATQIGLTSCFLAAIVIVTLNTRTETLKGSSLVTLTGLSDETKRHLLAEGHTTQELSHRAERMMVQLEDRDPRQPLQLTIHRTSAILVE